VANFRWPDGKAECQNCGSKDTTYMAKRRVYRCRECQKQFSVKVGSIFEESPILLNKWLAAVPKSEIDKREAEYKQSRRGGKRSRPQPSSS